jgi:hypothetical protein
MKVVYDTAGMEEMIDSAGKRVLHHPKGSCKNQEAGCPVHNPSEHKLNEAPLFFADELLFPVFFRVCEHGHRHPDPDSLRYYRDMGYSLNDNHECDGCCT